MKIQIKNTFNTKILIKIDGYNKIKIGPNSVHVENMYTADKNVKIWIRESNKWRLIENSIRKIKDPIVIKDTDYYDKVFFYYTENISNSDRYSPSNL